MARPYGVLGCPLRLDVSPRCCVAAIPAASAAPRGHSPTLRLGGGGCREAESSEASRDFDVWGGWLEDRHDHGFLHGWARARRLRSWPNLVAITRAKCDLRHAIIESQD